MIPAYMFQINLRKFSIPIISFAWRHLGFYYKSMDPGNIQLYMSRCLLWVNVYITLKFASFLLLRFINPPPSPGCTPRPPTPIFFFWGLLLPLGSMDWLMVCPRGVVPPAPAFAKPGSKKFCDLGYISDWLISNLIN